MFQLHRKNFFNLWKMIYKKSFLFVFFLQYQNIIHRKYYKQEIECIKNYLRSPDYMFFPQKRENYVIIEQWNLVLILRETLKKSDNFLVWEQPWWITQSQKWTLYYCTTTSFLYVDTELDISRITVDFMDKNCNMRISAKIGNFT